MRQAPRIFFHVLLALFPAVWPLAQCLAESGPDSVVLDTITQLYEPVKFDHASHVDLADQNCTECHHHTTGMAPVDPQCLKCHSGGQEGDNVACRECHSSDRFEAAYLAEITANTGLYHIDKPGLKGAYHQNCMGCHQKHDGPTGCQDCHARNERGDELFHSGKFAPDPAASGLGH